MTWPWPLRRRGRSAVATEGDAVHGADERVAERAVVLVPVDAQLRAKVLRLAPFPRQEPYSGAASRTLPDAEAHADRHPVAVLLQGSPVGFFVLDAGVLDYAPRRGTLGLRALFIDRGHQSRGIGSAALAKLPDYVRRHHPDATAVALTVNIDNDVAIHVYRGAGFVDTGEMYHGGRLGPQRVLVLALG